jgi:hypothetical protein
MALPSFESKVLGELVFCREKNKKWQRIDRRLSVQLDCSKSDEGGGKRGTRNPETQNEPSSEILGYQSAIRICMLMFTVIRDRR